MKILIVSDAAPPQINGVVRMLEALSAQLVQMGHTVRFVGPDPVRPFSFSLPSYREITLELFARPRLAKILEDDNPEAIHIATEGPLGWAMRSLCFSQKRAFTTAYHTRFPAYLAERVPPFLAKAVSNAVFAVLRRFHAPSSAVIVPTASIESALCIRKFRNLVRIPHGVDTGLFKPYGKDLDAYENFPRPILLYVGRVSNEKNLQAFLDIQTTGSKVVIGDGPDKDALRREYPEARFLGPLGGEILARHFAAADLFVFPSKTDTFGLVLLEACASGLRCAAYPVTGPADIFIEPSTKAFAVLDENLQTAVDKALVLPDVPELSRAFAQTFSWRASAEQFLKHAQQIHSCVH